jgi:cytochrome c oxidase subunit 3
MSSADSSGVLAHHFDTMEQQQGAARLGMWMFLVTEVLFFGGIFVAYTAYRIWYPKDFEAGSSRLNILIGTINSLLLLTSSLTITLAIHAAHEGRQDALRQWLLVTIGLGLLFLGFKTREYQLDFEEHLIPGRLFNQAPAGHGHARDDKNATGTEGSPRGPTESANAARTDLEEPGSPAAEFRAKGVNPARVQLFFVFYYCMTGLHVLHMVVGIGLIAWLYHLARKNYFVPQDRFIYVEVTSLYWHFVDMIWFFLMALLYCAGPHSSAQLHL